MNKHEAREVLIEACVNDYANTLMNDAGARRGIARFGFKFKGFEDMSDEDLVQSTIDAGLNDDDAEAINRAIKVLRGEVGKPCVVSIGNSYEGVTLYGPFPNTDAANKYMDNTDAHDWHIVELQEPK